MLKGNIKWNIYYEIKNDEITLFYNNNGFSDIKDLIIENLNPGTYRIYYRNNDNLFWGKYFINEVKVK